MWPWTSLLLNPSRVLHLSSSPPAPPLMPAAVTTVSPRAVFPWLFPRPLLSPQCSVPITTTRSFYKINLIISYPWIKTLHRLPLSSKRVFRSLNRAHEPFTICSLSWSPLSFTPHHSALFWSPWSVSSSLVRTPSHLWGSAHALPSLFPFLTSLFIWLTLTNLTDLIYCL